ncbi:MAG: hypothetical protein Q8L80_00980 [Gallionella sp.]|nr:hypothetical protein [Gallionella sp.]MDP1939821.1 hypothetical protein [Gallionella sp.]
MLIEKDKLERIESIASICSSIAIPLVLAVMGYFVQKQFAEEGLKKDYVSIAAGILKDDPSKQEPDLRQWAVNVLDSNSPIPFSKQAKDGLLKGVVAGPGIPPPISDCMKPPKKRTVLEEYKKLADFSQTADADSLLKAFNKFSDVVKKEEIDALYLAEHLKCMQAWAKIVVESDTNYRKSIGAEDSKSIYKRLQKEKMEKSAASVVKPKAPSHTVPSTP